jgi:serine/threonine protein kinase
MENLGRPSSGFEDTNELSDGSNCNSRKILRGRYQVISEIKIGGAGKTYLVDDLGGIEVNRCILKHFQIDRYDGKKQQVIKEYCKQAAVILQRLGSHEQIPQFLDYYDDDREIFLVLEYISGTDLRQEIKQKTLTESQTITFLFDVLKILEFVHKNNLIHDNIQPKNIIRRTTDGKLFLVDFSSFKKFDQFLGAHNNNDIEILNSERIIESEDYLAPEKKANCSSFSSEIYALGQIAIYALTGKKPSELKQQEKDKFGLVSWYKYCQIDAKLQAVIDKMTCPQVRDRYQSVSEILIELKPLLLIEKVLLGRYKVQRFLGERELIDTFLAKDIWLKPEKFYVIKQITIPLNHPDFVRELESYLAKLLEVHSSLENCKKVAKIIDHFQEKKKFYLVREFIAGDSLEKYLQQQRHLNFAKVVQLLREGLEILKCLHQQGIIHQNIKPENLIFCSDDGKIALTDIGKLTEHINPLAKVSLSLEEKAYIAPEQLAGRATFSSDIYALGTVAIQALTGINPRYLSAKLNQGEVFWQQDSHLNSKLIKILNKMICADLSNRYQSAKKVLEDLDKTINLSAQFLPDQKIRKVTGTIVDLNLELNLKKYRQVNWWKQFGFKYLGIAILAGTTLLAINELFRPTIRSRLYLHQGTSLLSKQPEQALAQFQKVIDFNPKNFQAWQGRGNSLYQLGRFREALSAYDEAIALGPQKWQIWQNKADTLFNLEEFEAAINAYDRVLALNAKDGVTLNRKGKALAKLERYQEAFEAQQAAISIDPNNAEAISDKGEASIGLGRYQEALVAFDRVKNLAPEQPKLWQDRAIALEALDQKQQALSVYQSALAIYDRALRSQPANFDNWLEKAKILTRLKLYPQAIHSYHKALAINPNSPQVWQGKGSIFLQLNNLPKALEAFDRVIDLVPNSSRAWRDRALVLSQTRRESEAIDSFQKAIEINPKDYQAWIGKGLALASLERRTEALAALKKAAEIEPNNTSVWLDRGEILAKWGNYSQACDSYQKAIAIEPKTAQATEALDRLNCD